ncbi:MAG: molybdopterin-dependent oxidoreductase [Bacteroidetes bacterium]|nr:molybdopterin-dependent oxidoreductase [Bacteroidota bacterium]
MMVQEENKQEEKFRKVVRRKTVRAFSWFFLFLLFLFAGWKWLVNQPNADGLPKPLRKILHVNEKIFSGVYSDSHLSKEYPKSSAVSDVRVNGDVGMKAYDTSEWTLQVVRFSPFTPVPGDTFYVTLDEIKKLPRTEVVFNFKCIEGWSQVTWWGGVKFSDFAAHYRVGTRDQSAPDKEYAPGMIAKYAGLVTPDGEYYVGIDMASMLHPQTILCYEMNGKPLPMNQGAPLRLIIPVKYGVKHIKRIGTLFFSAAPPPDYWFEQGYDYYAGL